MKLFIIGKTGQLGSDISKNATLSGYDVISPSRQEFDISTIINKNNRKFINKLKNNKPDIVINCAAYNNVPESEMNQLYSFNINCIAVKNMADICNQLNIEFISFSTDYVFDGKKGNPYIETDNPNPVNMYGLTKLSGEYASLIYENTTIIRTCGLYGLNSTSTKNGKGNFIDNRIKDSKNNTSISIDCSQIVSPTYTKDLSKAVLELIDKKNKSYNLFHLVNEGFCTWYDLTKEVYNILNIDTEVIPVDRSINNPNSVRRPLFSALKNTRAKKLGIILSHWREALRNYLEVKYKDGI